MARKFPAEVLMRRLLLPRSIALAICLLFSLPVSAGKFSASDFPLRVLILYRNGNRHYHGMGGGLSSLEQVDGLGGADLFENGQPTAFDFNYNCSQPITPMPEYETFMARWKKPGRILQIVMPVMGKPGDMNSCDLNVTLKQGIAYFHHNGGLSEEPSAQFKEWMIKHQYDPEHGKNIPVALTAEQPASAQPIAAPAGVQ
jgi:hypothetical protein